MTIPAIRAQGVWKQYAVGRRARHGSLYETLSAFLEHRPARARPKRPEAAQERTFWALRDLTFEVAPGDVLGVIGRNGAGKSTLLKVLSRISAPSRGRIEILGRIASLLEVGTGFHPELTGRENIFLNGAILGMTKREIVHQFDTIVQFAEVERFLDTPVKRYSSGMYVRLAFAVAAHLDADVLLVDEVLAVGDAEFQEKCMGKMRNVSRQGRTVLFVSHNMGMITELCNRCMLLDRGECRSIGTPEAVVREYFSSRTSLHVLEFNGPLAEDIRVTGLRVNGANATGAVVANPTESIHVAVAGVALRSVPDVQFALTLGTNGVRVATLHDSETFQPLPEGEFTVELTIPPALLRPGDYALGFGADRQRVGSWFYGDNLCRLTLSEQWDLGYPPNRRGLINLTPDQVQATRRSGSEESSVILTTPDGGSR